MTLRAAFFDVGDTLVEHWPAPDAAKRLTRARISAGLGELWWLDEFLEAELQHKMLAQVVAARRPEDGRFAPDDLRQETHRWFSEWLVARGIELSAGDVDRLRSLMCVPLADVTTPVPGAFEAIRWCADRGLRVILVTNSLSHGDTDVLEDFRRFGLLDAIHGVATSHSVGWRKPHPAIFERALELADVKPDEAFHVGDNLILDVFGARQLGMRAVWRRIRNPSGRRGRGETPLSCGHPSECLFWDADLISCARCGQILPLSLRPDAVVDDLTELQAIASRW